MTKMLRAGSAALLSLALIAAPAHADYVGSQAGGGGNITYGAFAPTINGVVTQLTKSVPVDPVTGAAIPLATSTKQPALGAAGAPSADVLTVQGAANATPILVDTVVKSTPVNNGGVLTTANTAVTLVAANSNRRGVAVQNRNPPSGTYNAATSVFMNCLTTATQDFNSLEIPAGAYLEPLSQHTGTGPCSFVSATANTPVYVRAF